MSGNTSIQWTDATWSPVVGCFPVSSGCSHCWAARQASRRMCRSHTDLARYGKWLGEVRCLPDRLYEPLHWKKPRRIAVSLMGDLFHEKVPDSFIARVFSTMGSCPHHTFQVLTKRPSRMLSMFRSVAWAAYKPLPNIWLGVSVEDQKTADERIPLLLQTPAAVRFVSFEPLLGRIVPQLISKPWCEECGGTGYGGDIGPGVRGNNEYGPCDCREKRKINWVICGGESGPGARPCDVDWIRSLVEQCKAAGVPCFVKQLGARPLTGLNEGEVGTVRVHLSDNKGGDPAEWPENLRVREFPI